MAFVNLKQYLKLNENISIMTDKYSDIVALYKEFQELLGEKPVASTGLNAALKKLNEVILDFKGELSTISDPNEPKIQTQTQVQDELPMELPGDIQDETQDEFQIPDAGVIQTQEEDDDDLPQAQ